MVTVDDRRGAYGILGCFLASIALLALAGGCAWYFMDWLITFDE
jgi:hypothetical protein